MPRFGLALGGGAALGYAHVGVLAALHENGLKPDAYSGTSAGALVAALAAFGIPPDTLRDRLGKLTWPSVADPSLSRLGLLKNDELGTLVHQLVGAVSARDAPVLLVILATDILTGERVVLRDALLADAVRASAAVPGVFAPVSIGGRLLVDGALVENVPVSPLREAGVELVVGVDVIGHPPFSRVSTAAQVLTNAAYILLQQAGQQPPPIGPDIRIAPNMEGRKPWDARRLTELWDAGWKAGSEAVPAIRAALHPDRYETP